MANELSLIEGFDHVGSGAADMSRLADKSLAGTKGWNDDFQTWTTSTNITPVTGRDSQGLAMRFASGLSNLGVWYEMTDLLDDSGSNGWVFGGFAFRISALPVASAAYRPIIFCLVENDASPAVRGFLSLSPGGQLAWGGDNGGSAQLRNMQMMPGTTGPVIQVDTWHCIKFAIRVSQAATSNGALHLWLDGRKFYENDAAATYSATVDLGIVGFYKDETGYTQDIDDFWFGYTTDQTQNDGFNPAPNRFSVLENLIRDPQVRISFPDGDGNQSDWTPEPSAPTTNYTQVDDNAEDGDTSYVSSATNDHIDLYTFPAVGSDVNKVHGVNVAWTSREDGTPGSEAMAGYVRHSTNESSYQSITVTNTAYATKMARVFRPSASAPSDITTTIVNGGAESETGAAPLTSWIATGASTSAQGSQATGTPTSAQEGSNWFYFDGTSLADNDQVYLQQTIALSTDAVPVADVDAGLVQFSFSGYLWQVGSDFGRVEVDFLNADGDVMWTSESGDIATGGAWSNYAENFHIPPGTRSLNLRVGGFNNTGSTTCSVYWDDITAVYSYLLGSDDSFTIAELDAAEFGIDLLSST